MTLQEAIEARHSVRAYKEQPLTEDVVRLLEEQIALLNRDCNLRVTTQPHTSSLSVLSMPPCIVSIQP